MVVSKQFGKQFSNNFEIFAQRKRGFQELIIASTEVELNLRSEGGTRVPLQLGLGQSLALANKIYS